MKKLYFTKNAEQHLTDIYNFSIEHWGRDRANLYLLRLEQTLQTLCQQPLIAMRRANIGENVFSFPIDRHIVYFRLSEDNLTIMAVLHQNQLANKDLL